MMPLLRIKGLKVGFKQFDLKSIQTVVHEIDMDVFPGEMVGVLGESGSGKTVSTKSILKVPSESFVIQEGTVEFETLDLGKLDEKKLRMLRGKDIGYIPQNASDALTPHETVWKQLEEMGRLHGKKITWQNAIGVLESVGIHNADLVMNMAAHQLSGGLAQRVVIAMTSLLSPKLIIADEPTSSVDATLKNSVLELLKEIAKKHGTAILIITHDFDVIEKLCQRAYVLYKGKLMEAADVNTLLEHPLHPYTQMLMASVQELSQPLSETLIKMDRVRDNDILLEALLLKKTYWVDSGFLKPQKPIRAVNNFSLKVPKGSCYGLIGESGSGKSTIGKLIMGLVDPDEGSLILEDMEIVKNGKRLIKSHDLKFKSAVQVVFQLASNPLDPRRTVRELLSDPFRIYKNRVGSTLEQELETLLSQVKLPSHYLNRLPGELSGGERQRVCIAKALAVKPKLLILDEPVSALDVSIQGQMMALLMELQETLGLTYIMITHDMLLARRYCTHIAVLYRGDLLENGLATDILTAPSTDYTRELIKEIPPY